MAEEKDLPRLHIVLDASKVNRCIWCGSPYSDKWIPDHNGMLCSEDCFKAKYSNSFLVPLCITFVLFSLIIIVTINMPRWNSNIASMALLGLCVFFLVSIFATLSSLGDRKYATQIPKGSRRHVGVSRVSLLQKVSAPIECPNCDGKINLRSIGEDMVYTCQYCGANGIIDIKLQR